MELCPRIHMITTVRGANTYVVLEEPQGGPHLTLIDSGMPGNATRIVDFLGSLGKVETLSYTIALTHPDIDHSGSVAELKERLGNMRVAIYETDAARLAGEKPLREMRGIMSLLFKMLSPFIRFKPVKPDMLLKDGERVNGLSVIHTPGHSEGSICLYSEDLKAMFAYLQTVPPIKHRVDNTEPPTPCKVCGFVHGLGDRN
jgi:glyoxylase-like metal-dependent hydrolase (beta-lactamase superfamily II)